VSETEGYVYLIKSQCRSVVKIGKAIDPIKRIKEIQTGSADPLYLHATIYSENPAFLENQIHKLLKRDWVRGEWFRFTENTEKVLSEYCKENSLKLRRCDFAWHHSLHCELHGFQIFGPNYLHIYIRDGQCCLMESCINLAMQILPKVEIIQTYSGIRIDTRYLLHKGEWVSHIMKEVDQCPVG
jgi:hypothetical protein